MKLRNILEWTNGAFRNGEIRVVRMEVITTPIKEFPFECLFEEQLEWWTTPTFPIALPNNP